MDHLPGNRAEAQQIRDGMLTVKALREFLGKRRDAGASEKDVRRTALMVANHGRKYTQAARCWARRYASGAVN
jgi:chorismate-pyruvate lyase